jgi:hypothetical protein
MDFSKEMWQEIPGLMKHHYEAGNANWFMIIYLSTVHVLGGHRCHLLCPLLYGDDVDLDVLYLLYDGTGHHCRIASLFGLIGASKRDFHCASF